MVEYEHFTYYKKGNQIERDFVLNTPLETGMIHINWRAYMFHAFCKVDKFSMAPVAKVFEAQLGSPVTYTQRASRISDVLQRR